MQLIAAVSDSAALLHAPPPVSSFTELACLLCALSPETAGTAIDSLAARAMPCASNPNAAPASCVNAGHLLLRLLSSRLLPPTPDRVAVVLCAAATATAAAESTPSSEHPEREVSDPSLSAWAIPLAWATRASAANVCGLLASALLSPTLLQLPPELAAAAVDCLVHALEAAGGTAADASQTLLHTATSAAIGLLLQCPRLVYGKALLPHVLAASARSEQPIREALAVWVRKTGGGNAAAALEALRVGSDGEGEGDGDIAETD
jgi:hypothetical protein